MKIMFSAGEASGDLHGAGLARALYAIDPELELIGFGGTKMQEAGVELCCNYQDYNVMGFWEVLKNLSRLSHLLDRLSAIMQQEKPDLLVLIDYPDFNWRLAKKAKKAGIPVFSYIPPSAWAWRKGRAKSCAKLADEMVAIFPFEVDAYRRAGAEISFVGNPLVDTVQPSMSTFEAKKFFGIKAGSHPVLLLPGSRRQEIGLLLPVMLASAERLAKACPATEFFLPVAPNVDTVQLRQMIAAAGVEVHLTTEYTYDLMGIADFAIAASGTVVMEAAIMGLPSIVLYRMSPFTYFIGRLLVHVESFSLPNILLGRPLQPELLQAEVTPERIVQEARGLYAGQEKAIAVKAGLAEAVSRLGAPGASERVANLIYLAAKKSQESTKGIMGA